MVDISEYAELEWSDDVLIIRFITDKHIDLEVAKAITAARYEFSERKDHKLVVSFPKIAEADPDAKRYWSSPEAKEHILANAIVTPTVVAKLIVNFFLGMNKGDKYPRKLFDTETEALFWIKNLK